MEMESRRASLLLNQLGRAQRKISTLEEFIRERERQLHSAVSRGRLDRRDSRPLNRIRRVGLSSDLLRMRSVSRDEEDPDSLLQPLSEYVCLRLCRVLEREREDGEEEEEEGRGRHIPFVLQRLVGRHYHVGPEQLLIGTGPDCLARLPREAGLREKHVALRWVPTAKQNDGTGAVGPLESRRGSRLTRQGGVEEWGGGHFVLEDLTRGEGGFRVVGEHERAPPDTHQVGEPERAPPETHPADQGAIQEAESTSEAPPLTHVRRLTEGVRFVTSRIEWSVTALPPELLLTHRLFAAARCGSLDDLRAILDRVHSVVTPFVVVSPADGGAAPHPRYSTISVVGESGFDVNTEFQPPSYAEDSYFNQLLARRRSTGLHASSLSPLSPLSPTSLSSQLLTPSRLLLHIAIEQSHLPMVKYLLEKGANPNLCAGELHQNGLHLAAKANSPPIMVELLRSGGDVEVTDSQHCQPLALTSSYETRKLLLSAVLLCCAAEAGDMEEVVRLVSLTTVSPNALGLRHKSGLHLAAAQGHTDIVEFLLLNGANVGARGGSQQRTALHYASVGDHVGVARLLLQAGANEFARDAGGYTPLTLSLGGDMCKLLHKQPLSLCLAVQSGDLAAVEEILREGGGGEEGEGVRAVDLRNEQSHAPLHLACAAGNLELASLLVSHGADVNLHGGSDGWTPLFYAAMGGHGAVVEFLLSVGADTEELDCHGNTVQERVTVAVGEMKERLARLEKMGRTDSVVEQSLHTLIPANMMRQESASSCSVESELAWLRSRSDSLRLIASLLTSGPERLLNAMETRNLEEFTSLLESGGVAAGVLVDKRCPTPALVRACEDGLYAFAEALLRGGAESSPTGHRDQVPLLIAAGKALTDLVQLLLSHGADISVQCCDSLNTPLHEAARVNSVDCVQLLLKSGADKVALNVAGETPFDCTQLLEIKKLLAFGNSRLLVAVATDDPNEVERLVESEGVELDHAFPPHGATALHEACREGGAVCVGILLKLGANPNKQTRSSLVSPLHLASRNDSIATARLLLGGGARLDAKDSEGRVPFEVAVSNAMRKLLVEARSMRTQPVALARERSSERPCMICMDRPINTILLPCGHQAFCTSCVAQITMCALDRQPIREVITVYK